MGQVVMSRFLQLKNKSLGI
ncbi:hypothetical protein Goarm_003314, partial [Gossypium armourianum]|nr:hypothetical protein [Gossypium armourianum]